MIPKGHVSIQHNIVYVGDRYGIIRWSNGRGEGFGLCQFTGPSNLTGAEWGYIKQIGHGYPYSTFDVAMSALLAIDAPSQPACARLLFGGLPE